ncbi:MAG: alpha/beta hydrolase [Pirellulaceae bacterium]
MPHPQPFHVLVLIVLSWTASVTNAVEPIVLPVWPGEVPGEEAELQERILPDQGGRPVTRITDVGKPTLHVYSPTADKANGCGVVVCPGGGYHILAWDLEGTEVAEWFNSFGVTAVVLKYRVPRRSPDSPHQAPLQDVQRAIRLVRHHAQEWKIDPDRIGVLGFSAGGHLTVMAGTQWDQPAYDPQDDIDAVSAKPNFMMPIYPAYLHDKDAPEQLSPLVRITEQTPPTFIAVTWDDADRGAMSGRFLAALHKANVPAELHVFSKGGHGYGLRPSDDPVSQWPKLAEQWMKVSGLLDAN